MAILQNANAITPASGFELKSGRFNDDDSAWLSKAYESSGNRRTWTYSCWAKRGEIDQQNDSLLACDYGPRVSSIGFMGTGTGVLQMYDLTFSGGSYQTRVASTAVYRDPAAWYHIVVKYDTTQGTASDRVKLYVNGEQITDLSQTTYPSQNYEGNINYGNDSRLTGIGKNTGTADYYDGLIAESYFLDGSAVGPEYFGETNSTTGQWQPKNPTDIKEGVTFGTNGFYLPFSVDALNNSFTNSDYHVVHTVTPIGTAHTDTTIKKFGTASCQLDGNSDYLSLPDSMDWVLGTGDFTLEAWVYNTTASGTQRLFSHTAHNVNGEQGFNIILDSGGTGRFTWSTNGNNEYSWNFANCMTQNTWTHFALTRTGTSLKVFKNGVLADSTTNANLTTIYGGGKPLFIGAMNQSNTSVTGYFEGYIDEVRFSNIVRYYGSFSVATAAFTADKDTKLLLHMDGSDGGTTFTDSSWTGTGGTGLSISETGDMENVRIKRQNLEYKTDPTGGAHFIGPKFGTGCLMADESNDNLVVPSSTDWAWGTGDFTVETWANVDMIGNHNELINCGGQDWRFAIESNGKPSWNHSGSGAELTSTIGVIPHKWFHLAVSRSSGTSRMFLDGVLVDSAADTHSYVADTLTIGSYSTGSYGADGYMDEIRISNSARYTAAFTPDTTAFSNDANTKLLVHCDGAMGSTNIPDSTTGARNVITLSGNVHTDTAIKKIGTASAQFPGGASDYLSVPKECLTSQFGSNDFTIEFWMYPTDVTNKVIMDQGTNSDNTFQFWLNASSKLQIYMDDNGSGWSINPASNTTIVADTWVHVACVHEGSNIKLYLDGTLDSNFASVTLATMNTGSHDIMLGDALPHTSGDQFAGYLDEIRISNTARYTANFTPSTSAFTNDDNTYLLMHCDGANDGTTFTDSATGHPISVNGDARVVAPKFGKGCYRNNGSGNGLAIRSGKEPWAEFDTGKFTVEAWVCLDNIGTNNQQFFTHRWGVNSGDWVFWWDSSTGLNWSGSSNTLAQGGTTGWANNTWVHIAACRSGTTNRIFVNGTVVATNTSATQNYNATAKVYLMSYGTSSGDQSSGAATGFMDEARIIQGKALFIDFTPATTAFSSDANTKLLMHMDGSDGGTTFTDSSGSPHTITPSGNTHTDTTIKKIGTASAQFDGNGDYLTLADSADWDIGTNWTAEFWAYNSTSVNDTYVLNHSTDADNLWGIKMNTNCSPRFFIQVSGTNTVLINGSANSARANQWTHYAIVKEGSVWTWYINGEYDTTVTDSSADPGFSGPLYFSRNYASATGQNFTGYIDEVRISNTARYTANFTPPTSAYNDGRDTPFLMHMDGGILIDETTGFATGAGEGIYAYNAAVNAIFYEPATPNLPLATNKSIVNFPGNGYLGMPNSADFEFGTGDFTIECWMYLTKDQDNRSLFGTDADGSNSGCQIEFVNADEHIATYDYDLEGNWNEVTKSNKPIPLGRWIHFAYVRNSLAFTLYINGVAQTPTGFTSNNAVGHSLGPHWGFHRNNSSRYLDDVYLDQMRISNNARYSVNFTPPTTPFTADANTLSLIQSDWSEGSLGADHSGNYNTFTPNNMGADTSTKDSPLTNFCTVNPLTFPRQGDTTSLWGRSSEGNLRWTSAGSSWGGHCFFGGTFSIAPNTGKYYWEMLDIGNKSVGSFANYGWGTGLIVVNDGPNGSGYIGRNTSVGTNTGYRYNKAGNGVGSRCQYNGTASAENIAVPCSVSGPYVFKFCYDSDNGKFYMGGDAGWSTHDSAGTPETSAAPTSSNYLFDNIIYDVTPLFYAFQMTTMTDNMHNFGQDASFGGNVTGTPAYATDESGYGEFYYTPPSGYKALCAANLPAPSIYDGEEHMKTIQYTGNASTLNVTGTGFKADWIWLKQRDSTENHFTTTSAQGVDGNKYFYENLNSSEGDRADGMTAISDDGFSLGSWANNNTNNSVYFAWNWKAGGHPTTDNTESAGTTPTAGSVKVNGANQGSALAGTMPVTRMSVNTTNGFSVLSYDGTAAAGTLPHGLSAAPAVVITKERTNVNDWFMYHRRLDASSPQGYYIQPNLDATRNANANIWAGTAPTSSVFTVGTDSGSNSTSRTYVAWCFQEIEGYSKFGGYLGNGNADGAFIYTGFKPQFVWFKSTTYASQDWRTGNILMNPYNPTNYMFQTNKNNAQESGNNVDFLSNGFKLRISGNGFNNSGASYIYLAFAESPFKTSNAR